MKTFRARSSKAAFQKFDLARFTAIFGVCLLRRLGTRARPTHSQYSRYCKHSCSNSQPTYVEVCHRNATPDLLLQPTVCVAHPLQTWLWPCTHVLQFQHTGSRLLLLNFVSDPANSQYFLLYLAPLSLFKQDPPPRPVD